MKNELQVFHDQHGTIKAIVLSTRDEAGRSLILQPKTGQLVAHISAPEYDELTHDDVGQQMLLRMIESHRVDMQKTPARLVPA
jgi:hypothetical protein